MSSIYSLQRCALYLLSIVLYISSLKVCDASVTKQYNLVLAKGLISIAGKVTVGLVESNGRLPPGL